MNKKLFSINLNFDSLGEAYGWPKDFYEDNTFIKGVDRILVLNEKFIFIKNYSFHCIAYFIFVRRFFFR